MQGLADGYFVIPYTLGNYLANAELKDVTTSNDEFAAAEKDQKDKINKILDVNGDIPVDDFHRELGLLVWDKCGMSRSSDGLKEAIEKIKSIRESFWKNVYVPGPNLSYNQNLEKALRVADFLEFAETMCLDALTRNESCGGHFREESQTPEGEALRVDDEYQNVYAWEYTGVGNKPNLHIEELDFEFVKPSVRSYK